jgi:hypothetical protein
MGRLSQRAPVRPYQQKLSPYPSVSSMQYLTPPPYCRWKPRPTGDRHRILREEEAATRPKGSASDRPETAGFDNRKA